MDLQDLYNVLERVYATNFVAYQRAHASHMNIRGRNFMSDHKLLKKIYQYLENNVDVLGEEIQACGVGRVPETIQGILDTSIIADDAPEDMDADTLLMDTLDNLYKLIDCYHEMNDAGMEIDYPDVSNMAADHIQNIAIFCWKIEATLEIEGRHTDRGRNRD
jgi:DNA-binding ferritin-like protein